MRCEQRLAAFKKNKRRRNLVEEFFGWAKTLTGMRRAWHVEREKITKCVELAAAAYNLVRTQYPVPATAEAARVGCALLRYGGKAILREYEQEQRDKDQP